MFLHRYIESGCYRGFTSQIGKDIISKESNISPNTILLWQVYTDADLQLKCNHIYKKSSKINQLKQIASKTKGNKGKSLLI